MTGAVYLLAAAPLFPFLLALACVLGPVRRRAPYLLAIAAVPGLLAALLAPGGVLVLPPAPFRITLFLDVPGAILLGASSVLWIAAAIYTATYLRTDPGRRGFSIWWLLTLAGSQGVFLVADLTSFYLSFALVSLAAYGLAAHDDNAGARRAGIIYLILTLLSEALLLMAFVMLASGGANGNPMIRDVVAALPAMPLRNAIIALLVLGFGLKMGLVPLHVWMPLAHSVAPVPASAVLSGIVVKAGVIGLMRFLPFGAALADWGLGLMIAGLFTAYYGILIGLTQTQPKTVLAYSTVSQMGVVGAVLGAGLAAGDAGALVPAALYAANHILLKGALFLGVGVAIASRRNAVMPVLAISALTGLSLAGLPFTGGALAKLAIKGPMGDSLGALVLALSAAGTTLLMLRFLACLRTIAGEGEGVPPGMRVTWFSLAALALVAPFALYPLATGSSVWTTLTPADIWKTLWPVLLGLSLATALRKWAQRLPRIPPGDLVVLAERLGPALEATGQGTDRLDAALRQWPMAMLMLVSLTLLLATVTVGL